MDLLRVIIKITTDVQNFIGNTTRVETALAPSSSFAQHVCGIDPPGLGDSEPFVQSEHKPPNSRLNIDFKFMPAAIANQFIAAVDFVSRYYSDLAIDDFDFDILIFSANKSSAPFNGSKIEGQLQLTVLPKSVRDLSIRVFDDCMISGAREEHAGFVPHSTARNKITAGWVRNRRFRSSDINVPHARVRRPVSFSGVPTGTRPSSEVHNIRESEYFHHQHIPFDRRSLYIIFGQKRGKKKKEKKEGKKEFKEV